MAGSMRVSRRLRASATRWCTAAMSAMRQCSTRSAAMCSAVRGNNDSLATLPAAQHDRLAMLSLQAGLDLPGGRLVVVHGDRWPAAWAGTRRFGVRIADCTRRGLRTQSPAGRSIRGDAAVDIESRAPRAVRAPTADPAVWCWTPPPQDPGTVVARRYMPTDIAIRTALNSPGCGDHEGGYRGIRQ